MSIKTFKPLIQGNQVIFTLPTKLTTRQRVIVKKLTDSGQLLPLDAYLASFKGGRRALNNSTLSDAVESLKAKESFDDEGNRIADNLARKVPGTFLEIFKRKRDIFGNYSISPSKAIKDGTSLGVEIECFIPLSLEALRSTFKERYPNGLPNIRVARDGSIDADEGYSDFEFRILTNTNDLSNLKEFCAFLRTIGARVNKSCGLHVHLDARAYDNAPTGMVNKLRHALPILNAMVPSSRINNNYCRADVSTSGERYAKINKESFKKHKTIEVRLHSGTTDFVKIESWIRILHSIAFTTKRITIDDSSTPAEVLSIHAAKLGWPSELVDYIKARIRKFNPSVLGLESLPNDTDDEQGQLSQDDVIALRRASGMNIRNIGPDSDDSSDDDDDEHDYDSSCDCSRCESITEDLDAEDEAEAEARTQDHTHLLTTSERLIITSDAQRFTEIDQVNEAIGEVSDAMADFDDVRNRNYAFGRLQFRSRELWRRHEQLILIQQNNNNAEIDAALTLRASGE